MLTGRATETTFLDTYFNIPAAATHSRSTTSRGDPQQEHDHRRFRTDHEAIEQDAPTIRASSSSDGKLIVAPDARVAVRLGQARALPGGVGLRADVVHVVRGVAELLEVVGHGRVGILQTSGVLFVARIVFAPLRGAVARRPALRDDLPLSRHGGLGRLASLSIKTAVS